MTDDEQRRELASRAGKASAEARAIKASQGGAEGAEGEERQINVSVRMRGYES